MKREREREREERELGEIGKDNERDRFWKNAGEKHEESCVNV